MRSRALVWFVALGSTSPFASACVESTVGPTPPITTVTLDGGTGTAPVATPGPADPPDGSAQATGDFFSCTADADCVAVPKNSCCQNGFNEAVNKTKVDAYKASFTCPPPKKICPMFRINDTRAPKCNASAHKCELVKTDASNP